MRSSAIRARALAGRERSFQGCSPAAPAAEPAIASARQLRKAAPRRETSRVRKRLIAGERRSPDRVCSSNRLPNSPILAPADLNQHRQNETGRKEASASLPIRDKRDHRLSPARATTALLPGEGFAKWAVGTGRASQPVNPTPTASAIGRALLRWRWRWPGAGRRPRVEIGERAWRVVKVRRRLQLRQSHAKDRLVGIALARFGGGRIDPLHCRFRAQSAGRTGRIDRRLSRVRDRTGFRTPLNRREGRRDVLRSEPQEPPSDANDDDLGRAVVSDQYVLDRSDLLVVSAIHGNADQRGRRLLGRRP